jgi:putative Holliday junction resolvase
MNKPQNQGNQQNNHQTGVYIGVDYGEQRTGVALGRNGFVLPLEIISETNKEGVIHQLIKFALDNKADAFIVGLPLQADNKETQQSLKTREFGRFLKITSRKPVIYQNEYGTSAISSREAVTSGVPKSKRESNDHLSAALILKQYFSAQNDL